MNENGPETRIFVHGKKELINAFRCIDYGIESEIIALDKDDKVLIRCRLFRKFAYKKCDLNSAADSKDSHEKRLKKIIANIRKTKEEAWQ